jgi:hypothetical protein
MHKMPKDSPCLARHTNVGKEAEGTSAPPDARRSFVVLARNPHGRGVEKRPAGASTELAQRCLGGGATSIVFERGNQRGDDLRPAGCTQGADDTC